MAPSAAPRRDLHRPFAALDALLLVGAALAANAALADSRLAISIAFAVSSVCIMAGRGAYDRNGPDRLGAQVAAAVGACSVAAMFLFVTCAIVDPDLPSAPLAWLWVSGTGLLAAQRAAASALRLRAVRSGRLSQPTLIIGAGRIGHLMARRLLADCDLPLRPVGFLDDDPMPALRGRVDLPVLGSSWELEQVVSAHGIEHVVMAFSNEPDHVLLTLARRCQDLGISVSVVPRLFEVEQGRSDMRHLGALPLHRLGIARQDGFQLRLKYAVDRVVAGVALVVLAPALGIIGLALRVTMRGPAFYRQERVGRQGRPFEMLKFRTMRGDPADIGEADAKWAAEMLAGAGAWDDDWPGRPSAEAKRTSRLGAYLRDRSLDELPQLINVLRGEMSLIGPRPERTSYVELFSPAIYRYADRHRVKPGLSGWAQVNGLRGETSLDDRVEWDNFYVENWSWALDARIVARTPASLHGPPEAAEADAEELVPVVSRPAFRVLRKLLGVTVAIIAMLLAVTATQAKASPAPSAIDQYVEQIPTAVGQDPLDGDPGASRGVPLSLTARASLRSRLRPAEAAKLEEISTAPELGAPQRSLPSPRPDVRAPGSPAAAVSALTGDGGGARLVWLALLLAGITVVAGGRAVHGRGLRDAAP